MPAPGVHRPNKPWLSDDDPELDVFPAERYFNGEDDDATWWRARSPSSSFSSAFRTYEHDRFVAPATSSSEASWNSRSALLPPDGKVLAAAAPSVVVVEEAESGGGAAGSERPRGNEKKSLPPPSSHLRGWLHAVAGCVCVSGGDSERSVSSGSSCRDDVEDDNTVSAAAAGGKKLANGVEEMFQRTESKEHAFLEAMAVRVKPSRWLDDGAEFLAGKVAALAPVQHQLAGVDHRRAGGSGESAMPIMNPAALLHEQRRKSPETPQPLEGDMGIELAPTTKHDASAFSTIVAGNRARGGGRIPAALRDAGEDDGEVTAPPSELGYPPSEASVVWSVATAEGAASCGNFSSAASGYYYYYRFSGGGEDVTTRSSSNRRRRSGVTNGAGGLLTCIGDKAVNAVRPDRCPEVGQPVSLGRPGERSDGRNRPPVA